MNTNLRTLLPTVHWELMTRRLLAFGFRQAKRFGVFGYVRHKLDDYVQEAVKQMLAEQRQFENFEGDEETLFKLLCGVVSSLLSHDLEKGKRHGQHLSIAYSRSDSDETSGQVYEDQLASPVAFDREVELRNRFNAFIDSLADERMKKYVVLRVADDSATAEDHARTLDTTVDEIRNIDRRLKRRKSQW